ncbi:PTS mannose transporter subunit IID [Lacticaseibacillus paracasei]|uniref:PTS mannose transporter subunit IID n=1 Tax=Lacticaseibacillus paracasei TaxID=1597 RepID=UPI001403AF1C|nr:PTS mannose transporter subunit IID [Lacticaseibacillus paracasei]
MQKRWQVRLLRQRVIIVILLFVGLLMGSVALYFEDRTNGLLRQVHDSVMMIFIGASPERFASSQLLWLLLWFGYMLLPIFASAGITHTYQQGLYPYLNLRFRPRVLTYLWPLKQTLMIETGLLLFMGAGFGLTTFLFRREQQLFTAGLFTGLIVMSQLLLLVMETVLEGYFGIVIGVVGPLVMIFLSFLQVPLMPLRFAIGSTFAGDQQILGAIGYQLVLIIGLVLIQIFYMPGRWGRYAANHT